MNTNKTITVNGGGVSLSALLGVTFIILKLTHVIDWSWWWVLAPFWVGLAFWVAIALLGSVLLGVAAVVGWLAEGASVRRSRRREALWAEKDARWENDSNRS